MLEPDRHAEEEELERYSLGDVGSDESARLEEHLLACESCRGRLVDYDLYTDSIALAAAQWRAEHREVAKRVSWFPRLAMVMGSLVLLAGAAVWLSRPGIWNVPAPVAIALSTTRGPSAAARAPARRPLALHPDLTGLEGLPTYDLQVVDRFGKQVARVRTTSQISPRISALASGTYFVRIYSPTGDVLREYALEVSN
jgi:hypothetical protein